MSNYCQIPGTVPFAAIVEFLAPYQLKINWISEDMSGVIQAQILAHRPAQRAVRGWID